ncbi:MAG: AraC-like transcriptional regulator QhpR [Alphaproteobacteria bacterium]
MTTGATISSAVLHGFQDRLGSMGVDARKLGRRCGVGAEAWSSDSVEIRLRDFVRLLELAAEESANPAFGWESGRAFDFHVFGDLAKAVLEAPTLGAALTTFSRYLRLVQTTSELRLDVGERRAIVSYRILDPDIWPRQQDAEFSIASIIALVGHCLGADWRPCAVGFEHLASTPEQSWSEEIDGDCIFGAEANTIELPLGALDCLMPSNNRAAWRRHSGELDRALAEREMAQATAARVSEAIYACFGHGPVNQFAVARKLGLSRRSLRRKLEAEGITFSNVLAETRLRLARRTLARTDRSLAQIALDLGYSDQSAFTRAFKLSGGQPPGRYRKAHEQAPSGDAASNN